MRPQIIFLRLVGGQDDHASRFPFRVRLAAYFRIFLIWRAASAVDRRRSPQSDVLIFRGSDDLEPEPFAEDVGPSDQRQLSDSQKEQEQERPEQNPPPNDKYVSVSTIV